MLFFYYSHSVRCRYLTEFIWFKLMKSAVSSGSCWLFCLTTRKCEVLIYSYLIHLMSYGHGNTVTDVLTAELTLFVTICTTYTNVECE